jgi:hypothetical protein
VRQALGALVVAAVATGCGSRTHVTIVGPPRPDPQVSSTMLVTAPRADRKPTPAERAEIVAETKVQHGLVGHDACITYRVRVSRLDGRYAEVQYDVDASKMQNCRVGNGWTIMWKPAGKWRVKSDAGDGFVCDFGPPGVVVSLDGGCLMDIDRASRPDPNALPRIRSALAASSLIRAIGRRRLRIEDVWISRTRDFAAALLTGPVVTDNLYRTALLVDGRHWRVVAVARDVNFCRYAPHADLRELNLRC